MIIEDDITVDEWKTFIANTINIDKSRINYNNYNPGALCISFTITESENDNLQDLYNLINEKYHIISLTYPFIYEFN